MKHSQPELVFVTHRASLWSTPTPSCPHMHLLLIYSCSYLSEDMTATLYAPGLYIALLVHHTYS